MPRFNYLIFFSILGLFLYLFSGNNVFAQSIQTVQTTVGTVAGGGEGGLAGGKVHFYCQYGKVNSSGVRTEFAFWNIQQGKSFSDCNIQTSNQCDIVGCGCGPTSIAMIMTTQGKPKTPTEVALGIHREGCGGANSGLTGSEITAYVTPFLKRNGFTITGNLVSGGNLNISAAKKYLDSGYIILGGGYVRFITGGRYFLGGHAFVVSGYKDTPANSFDAYDPTFCSADHPGGVRPLYDVNNSNLNGNNNVEQWIYAHAIKKL